MKTRSPVPGPTDQRVANVSLPERAMQVFERVYKLPDPVREREILNACGDDDALKREVEMLLDNVNGIEIVRHEMEAPDEVFSEVAGQRYELAEEIGRGGMGTVFRAIDTRLGRTVAVKVMRGDPDNRDARRRFSEEARIAAGLQHPGIAPVYDSGLLADGQPFLAMKLIEGQTLATVLKDRAASAVKSPEDLSRLLSAFEALCQIIAYAHSQNIIHRDLKPDNVMIGAFGEVQVMDWGLAKWLEDHEEIEEYDAAAGPTPAGSWPRGSWTRLGTVMGTPAYMPPEQVAGTRSKQADVFALGAILCEILTGNPPYTANTEDEVLSKSARADLDEANQRLDLCDADADLVQLARQCLHADPDQRPADGAEVAGRVTEHTRTVQSRLREAEIEMAETATKRAEEKKRRRVTALLVMTGLLLFVVIAGGWQWNRTRQIRETKSLVARLNEAQQKAIRFHQSALDAPLDDLKAWDSARVAIEQAQSMLNSNVPNDLQREIDKLARQIASDISDRRLLSRIEQAREKALEQISIPGEPDPSEEVRLERELHDVFESTPLDPANTDTAAASAFIQQHSSPIKEAIIGAVDEWILVAQSSSHRNWLVDVVSAIDQNEWRVRWRNAVWQQNEGELLALLTDDLTFAQSPRSVLNLCRSVEDLVHVFKRRDALVRIDQTQFRDFWLDVRLGDNAIGRRNNGDALRYYQRALAVRPLSSLHRKLGTTRLVYPADMAKCREHAQRAIELNDQSADSWETLAETSFRLGQIEDARKAYKQRFALSSEPLRRVKWYVAFLQASDRGAAIDYLQSLRDSEALSVELQFLLIQLMVRENRYQEAVSECERMSAWPREAPQMAPMERIEASVAAIQAHDGVMSGSNPLSDDRRDRLLGIAYRWLSQTWVSWESRVTWQQQPVLTRILELRDSGGFDSVYRADALDELPGGLSSAWSELWEDVERTARRFEKLDSMMPEYGNWSVLEPIRVTAESDARFVRLDDGSWQVSETQEGRDTYTIQAELESTITAIRLDVLGDDQPHEIRLAEIELFVSDKSQPNSETPVSFDRADESSLSEAGEAQNAIDGDHETYWNLTADAGHSPAAVFHLEHPVQAAENKRISVRLVHGSDQAHSSIERFRLSVLEQPGG